MAKPTPKGLDTSVSVESIGSFRPPPPKEKFSASQRPPKSPHKTSINLPDLAPSMNKVKKLIDGGTIMTKSAITTVDQ